MMKTVYMINDRHMENNGNLKLNKNTHLKML